MRTFTLFEWVAPTYTLTQGRPSLTAHVLSEEYAWQELRRVWGVEWEHEEWERARVVYNYAADITNSVTIRRFLDHGIPMCL